MVEQEDVAHAPRRMVAMDAEGAAKYLAGFNANARLPASLFGLTLLEAVLLSDREELVKPMLDAGVNPFTADAKGYTAVEVALDRGQLDSAKMMLDTVRAEDDARCRLGFRGPSTVSYTRAVIRSIEAGLDATGVLRNALQPPLKADGADVPTRARLSSPMTVATAAHASVPAKQDNSVISKLAPVGGSGDPVGMEVCLLKGIFKKYGTSSDRIGGGGLLEALEACEVDSMLNTFVVRAVIKHSWDGYGRLYLLSSLMAHVIWLIAFCWFTFSQEDSTKVARR